MKGPSYDQRIQLLALAAGLPGSLVAIILLWTGSYSSGTSWTLTFLIVTLWMGFAFSLRNRVVFSLQTLSGNQLYRLCKHRALLAWLGYIPL